MTRVFRVCALLVLIVQVLACAAQEAPPTFPERSPVRTFDTPGQKSVPTITYLRSETAKNVRGQGPGEGTIEVFLLDNATPDAYRYLAWWSESPSCTREVLTEGGWKVESILFCGTGLWFKVLEPGERVEFFEPAPGSSIPTQTVTKGLLGESRVTMRLTNIRTRELVEISSQAYPTPDHVMRGGR